MLIASGERVAGRVYIRDYEVLLRVDVRAVSIAVRVPAHRRGGGTTMVARRGGDCLAEVQPLGDVLQ